MGAVLPALVVLGVALLGCGRVGFQDTPDAAMEAGIDAVASGFQGLCVFDRVTVVQNGTAVDEAVNSTLSTTMADGCHNAPATTIVSQDDPGVLDPATGRPLLAPMELGVIAGGDGPSRAIAYLLRADTPVIWSGSSSVVFTERSTGRTLAMGPTSVSHDFALVMVVVDPIGGAHVLSASGIRVNGTAAAGYWFATNIAPSIATHAETWFLVEWTNGDVDPAPSVGDTFAVLASGP